MEVGTDNIKISPTTLSQTTTISLHGVCLCVQFMVTMTYHVVIFLVLLLSVLILLMQEILNLRVFLGLTRPSYVRFVTTRAMGPVLALTGSAIVLPLKSLLLPPFLRVK